jgi:hypothetical protein
MQKTTYVAPVLEEIGSFEEITQAGKNGDFTDALFPSDTPKGKLTFS